MACITSCLRKVFCCGCCTKKPVEAPAVAEQKVHQIAINTLPLSPILQKRMLARSPPGEPSEHFIRQTHNRFVSREAVSMGTVLKE